MDEPIVSIYDMLVDRYKQQLKIDRVKGSRPTKNWNLAGATANDGKKLPKIKPKQASDNSSTVTEQQQTNRKQGNVVTASHLTQKPGGSVTIPVPTKKEVLNKLVERMSSKVRNVQSKIKTDAGTSKKSPTSKTSLGKKTKPKSPQESRSARSLKLKKIKRSSLPGTAKKSLSTTTTKKDDNVSKPVAASKSATAGPKMRDRSPVSGSSKSILHSYKSKSSLKDKSGGSLATPVGASRWRL